MDKRQVSESYSYVMIDDCLMFHVCWSKITFEGRAIYRPLLACTEVQHIKSTTNPHSITVMPHPLRIPAHSSCRQPICSFGRVCPNPFVFFAFSRSLSAFVPLFIAC